MNTPEEIVNEVLEDTYGGGTRYAEPNRWDEAGLTLALARGDVDESEVRELILRAIEIDRSQTTIYVAVIEWPDGLMVSPDLVAARSHADRMTQIQAMLAEVLGATDPEVMHDFRAAFNESPADFVDAVTDSDDSPIITFYERTV